MAIFISKFAARTTQHISDINLLHRVLANWDLRKNGYRDGVILVPISPDGFFTSLVTLIPGDKLRGSFKSRVEGEDPRKSVHIDPTYISLGDDRCREKPAVAVDVVLYRKDVLDEDNDWNLQDGPYAGDHIPDSWAVIAVSARPMLDEMPLDPDTLIANHFHLSGGTQTKMTNDQFVAALHTSVLFWKDKATLR